MVEALQYDQQACQLSSAAVRAVLLTEGSASKFRIKQCTPTNSMVDSHCESEPRPNRRGHAAGGDQRMRGGRTDGRSSGASGMAGEGI